MTTSTIQRWSRIAKLHFCEWFYSVSLFLNNGETLINKYCRKSWKNPKTAIKKIFEFINED